MDLDSNRFSLVCPIWHGDIQRIPQTFPSFTRVNPTEFVIAVDYTHEELPNYVELADRVVELTKKATRGWDGDLRVVKVKRNPEYKFQQAWVRRTGFNEATYDTILTADADLILNNNVHKAVSLVGKNNVGFCSLQKFLYPSNLGNLWRCVSRVFLIQFFRKWKYFREKRVMMRPFTGLYALHRPFWLDTEDDGIKDLVNPKQKCRGDHVTQRMEDPFMGEDTYLHHCMLRKYRCVYLNDVGAICLDTQLEDISDVQKAVAIYHAQRGRHFSGAIVHAVAHGRRHYLPAYIQAKRYINLTGKGITRRLDRMIFGGNSLTLYESLGGWVKSRSYEPAVSEVLVKQKGKLLVDIGAGVGYYSWLLHVNFDKVLAFEPYPSNCRFMRVYKEKHGIQNVEVLPYAISNKAGTSKLYIADNLPYQGQSSLDKKWVTQLNKDAQPDYVYNVETTTLDAVLADEPAVDLVKVDVEGFEWEVLEGAEKVMPRIKAWLIEVHDLGAKMRPIKLFPLQEKMDRMRLLMKSYGYTCERLDKDHIYCHR